MILATAVCFCSDAQAQNRSGVIIDFTDVFSSDFELIDLGLRPDGGLNVIGNGSNASGVNAPQLIDVAPDRLSFSSSELIGVRDTTEITGISSEGSRIVGNSISADFSIFEATTWQSTSPGSGLGIGFGGSSIMLSNGFGAWSGGVVGSNEGVSDAFRWTAANNDFQILPDVGGSSEANDVSSNGVSADRSAC